MASAQGMPEPPGDPAAPIDAISWVRVIDKAFALLFCLMVTNNVLISLAPISATLPVLNRVGGAGILVAVTAVIVATVMVFQRSLWMPVAIGLVVVEVAAQYIAIMTVENQQLLPHIWWGHLFTTTFCALLCGALGGARGWAALILTAGGYFWLRYLPDVTGPGAGFATAISETLVIITQALIALIVYPALRGFARNTDRAWSQSAAARLAAEQARIAKDHQRLVERFLHDEVIHTLRAVSLARGAINALELRQMCVRAAALMKDLAGWQADPAKQQDLFAEIVTVTAQSQLNLTVTSDQPERRRSLILPTMVSDALVGAVSEAVRNIAKHAGVNSGEIRITGTPRELEITVSDQGVGFDTATIRPHTFGISRSIKARMSDVGGDVAIHSHAGLGTTVRLRWHGTLPEPQQSPGPSGNLSDLSSDLKAPLIAISAPMLVTGLVSMVTHQSDLSIPWLGLTCYALLLVIAGGALVWSFSRPISGWMSLGLAVAAVTLATGNGLALHSGLDDYFAFGCAGAVGVLVALQALFRPLRESLITEATVLVVLTGTRWWMTDTAEVINALPALTSSAVGAGAAIAFRFVLGWMGRSVARAAAESHRARLRLSETTVRTTVSTARTSRFKSNVLPFFDLVALGGAAHNFDEIQRRAAVLEAEVRDDLQVGEALDDSTRALIAQARTGGTEVILNASGERLPSELMRLLVSRALQAGRWKRLVLSVYPAAAGDRVNLLVSPAPVGGCPALQELAAELGGRYLAAADSLVLHTKAGQAPNPRVPQGRSTARGPAGSTAASSDPTLSVPGAELKDKFSRIPTVMETQR